MVLMRVWTHWRLSRSSVPPSTWRLCDRSRYPRRGSTGDQNKGTGRPGGRKGVASQPSATRAWKADKRSASGSNANITSSRGWVHARTLRRGPIPFDPGGPSWNRRWRRRCKPDTRSAPPRAVRRTPGKDLPASSPPFGAFGRGRRGPSNPDKGPSRKRRRVSRIASKAPKLSGKPSLPSPGQGKRRRSFLPGAGGLAHCQQLPRDILSARDLSILFRPASRHAVQTFSPGRAGARPQSEHKPSAVLRLACPPDGIRGLEATELARRPVRSGGPFATRDTQAGSGPLLHAPPRAIGEHSLASIAPENPADRGVLATFDAQPLLLPACCGSLGDHRQSSPEHRVRGMDYSTTKLIHQDQIQD